jgi:hypothetical protein
MKTTPLGFTAARKIESIRRNYMGLQTVGISVQNDGNVSQLDVADQHQGGVFYRIEVYRCSHPADGYGVTFSGSRAEELCGADHLSKTSNRTFRYTFSLGNNEMHRGAIPTLLEGREEFNPAGFPDGSWRVRLRDLDHTSPMYGSILGASVRPTEDGHYEIHYELRKAENVKPVPFFSPLARKVTEINPSLPDISDEEKLPQAVGVSDNKFSAGNLLTRPIRVSAVMSLAEADKSFEVVSDAMGQPEFEKFRKNLDAYEEFGDFGSKPTHPGTNLIGKNAKLCAESIFVRQYRSSLVLLGRIVSPDMKRGASAPQSLNTSISNTRPGVYMLFVGASINDVGLYKLALDKVHSDYGGVPMRLAPGSRLEDDAKAVADAWNCNKTLGDIANAMYLAK